MDICVLSDSSGPLCNMSVFILDRADIGYLAYNPLAWNTCKFELILMANSLTLGQASKAFAVISLEQ